MGLFNKILFWRKKDDLDFDSLAEKEVKSASGDKFGLNSGLEEKSLFPEDSPAAFGVQGRMPAPGLQDKELDLINSKLDTIKAMLASIEQRLASAEQANAPEKKQRLW